VKPLDEERLGEVFGAFPLVAVVEEHGLLGGLGGSIAEWRARQAGTTARMLAFGCEDSSCTRSDRRTTRAAGTVSTPARLRSASRRAALGVAAAAGMRVGLDFDNTIVRYDALSTEWRSRRLDSGGTPRDEAAGARSPARART